MRDVKNIVTLVRSDKYQKSGNLYGVSGMLRE